VLADGDPGSRFSQGGRLPISLLSTNSPAQESSAYRMDGQHELIKEMADSSESVHSGTELEQTADIADSAPKGRAAPEAVLESSSQMQLDTRNFPGNIETNDPQHEPHGSPDVNSGNQAGERMNSENYGRSSGEVMNNDLEPGTSAVDEQEVVQPHDHDVGEKDGGGQEDDGDKG
jgi:hypothetical protein